MSASYYRDSFSQSSEGWTFKIKVPIGLVSPEGLAPCLVDSLLFLVVSPLCLTVSKSLFLFKDTSHIG